VAKPSKIAKTKTGKAMNNDHKYAGIGVSFSATACAPFFPGGLGSGNLIFSVNLAPPLMNVNPLTI